MTDHAQLLLHDALALPEGERAELVARLLVSLEGSSRDDRAAVERSWGEEVERRARRVLTGAERGEAWDRVRDRVGQTLTDR